MTTIQDVLTYADGSKANGRLAVFWRPFTIGNANVTGGELAYDIVEGAVSITLYPNAGALPSGSYYSAKYELENGAVYEEQWVVPNLPTVNLGQVRVSYPPTPSILISPTQLTSMNAQPGMFLMWDGARWVPGYPSTFNLDPNWIGVNIGALGDDINVVGSPVSVGNYVTIHIPDAGATARGVVSIGAQTFAGAKTLKDVATVSQSLIFAQHAIYAGTRGELVNVGSASAHALYFGGDIVAARVATTDRPRMQADRLVTGHIDIDTVADSPTAMMPGNASIPAKGTESILLPHDGVDWAGIGMGINGSLWLRTGGAFLYLNQTGVTCRELRMDPYQHPNAVGVEAVRNDAAMVIYSDATSWGGYGVNTTPELWFRMGPDNAGAYYYFGASGATFPSLSVATLVVSGAVTLPADSGLIPTFQIDGGTIGTRPILNFVQGTNVSIQGVEVSGLNRVDIHISAAGGGDSGGLIDPTNVKGDLIVRGAPKPAIPTAISVGSNGQVLTADSTTATGIKWASALPANDTSTQRVRISRNATLIAARQELNLIPGANVTLTVVDNPVSNRVDATVAVASMVTPLSPWTTDIDAAGFRLYSVGALGIGNDLSALPTPSGVQLVVGGPSSTIGRATLASNQPAGLNVGALCFANYAITGAEKRIVQINGYCDGAIDSGTLILYTAQAGVLSERARLTAAGDLGVGIGAPAARIHAVVSNAWSPGTVGVPGGGLVTQGAFGGGIGMIDGTKTIGLFSTNGDLNFAIGTTPTGLATRMIMSAAGYLGIGRSPEVTLDVLGSGVFRQATQQNPTSGQGLRVGYDTGGFGDVLSYNWSTPGYAPLQVRGNPTILSGGNVGIGSSLAWSTPIPYPLVVRTGANMNLWVGPQAAVTGAVTLHAANDAGSANVALELRGTPTVFSVGNVGMGGCVAPSYALSFGSNVGDRIALWEGGTGIYGLGIQSNLLQIYSQNTTTRVGIGYGSSASFTEVLSVSGNKCVGIGVTNPTDALVINGLPGGGYGQIRMVSGNYGVFFRNDGATLYCMITANGDPYGVWAAGYPWQIDLASHVTSFSTNVNINAALAVSGRITAGGGFAASNGNGINTSGISFVYSNDVNSDFNHSAIQVRESQQAGGGSSGDNRYAPRISFHWGGVVAAQLGMDNAGWIRTFDNPGTGFGNFMSGNISVNGGNFNVNGGGGYFVNGVPFAGNGVSIQFGGGAATGPYTFLNFVGFSGVTVSNGGTGGPGGNTLTIQIGGTSDSRLKRNVQPLDGGLPLIAQLRPISAEWNGLAGTREGERLASVMAQELQAVMPDAVHPYWSKLRAQDSQETELLSINSMTITAHLILAVQQLERRLKVLEGRN